MTQNSETHRTKNNSHIGNNTAKIIDTNKPLSQSLLWELQTDFYAKQGPEAWVKGIVPQYITTNPYIAELYAKLVLGYCRDIASCDDFDKTRTLYILELAAGVGRFTYTFLKRFLNKLEQSSLKELKVKYIISDLAERNADYWQSHTLLKPYFDSGILDCAVFDMSSGQELRLCYSKEVLKPGALCNPLILIANYTFDSLPIDTFYVNHGKLYEGLLTLTAKTEPIENKDNSILSGLDYSYSDRLTTADDYYEEPYLNEILKYYQTHLDNSAFSLPNIAIRCLKRLKTLFGDDLILISTDKGYRNLSSLQGIHHPYLSSHGSISLTVNFHALELYFIGQGGKAHHSIYEHDNVTLSVFLSGKRSHGFTETTLTCNEIMQGIGPDDFYRMKKALATKQASLTSRELLTFLRYFVWDARTFIEFYQTFLDKIEQEENFPKEEMVTAIHKVWEHYFPIGEEGDLAACLASLLAYFGEDQDAIRLYQASLQFYGEDAAINYEIAVCYYNLQEFDSALEYLDKSLSLAPGFEESLQLKDLLKPNFAG